MSKEFDNILDDCLERLLVKGETLEQCLQSYPEQASELRPLLETASAVKKASDIQPRAEFKDRARYQFRSALEEAASRKSRPAFGWFPRWATVVTMVLGILLIGSGTVAAAGYSMPDSPLYPVKLVAEQVQLKLTPSDIGKAELLVKLADKRISEIIYMANKGDAGQIDAIAQRLDKRLVMLVSLAPSLRGEGVPEALAPAAQTVESRAPAPAPAPAAEVEVESVAPPEQAGDGVEEVLAQPDKQAEFVAVVARYAVNHPAALRAVLENAPESAKPALLRAIAIAEARYQEALESVAD